MSAVVSDRMSGDKHNPNVELVAQGIANIVSPLLAAPGRERLPERRRIFVLCAYSGGRYGCTR